MAEVFLGACEVTPTEHYPVAIKRLYAHFGDDAAAVQMLSDEARLVANLSHQNIVKLYEVGVLESHHCLVMEYLEGQPLQRLMFRHGERTVLPVDVAVYVVLQVLEALEYAHNAKDRNNKPLSIVHRDISPQNVFITNDGCVKLLDFGIAKATSHEGRTVTGLVKGKFAYIAPEQALAQPIDGRTDLWSVGVILWELLAGRRLFKADNEAATLRATLRADVPKLSRLRPGVPVELERIVGRALQRHRSLRYGSAAEMKGDLLRHLRTTDAMPNSGVLLALMQVMFSDEIAKQQQLIANLANPDYSTLTTPYRTARSTAPSISQTSDTVAFKLTAHLRREFFLALARRLGRKAWVAGMVIATIATLTAIAVALTTPKSTPGQHSRATNAETVVKRTHEDPGPFPDGLVVSQTKDSKVSDQLRTPKSNNVDFPRSKATSAPIVPRHQLTTKQPVPSLGASTIPASEPAMGFLTLDTSPWSQVSLRGKSIGQTPIIGVRLPIGTHVLVLRNPDLGIETSYSVNITEGATTTKRIGLQ